MAEQLVIKINGDVKNYQDALNEVQGETENLQKGLARVTKSSAIAFGVLSAAIGISTRSFIGYEKALIGVGKTTDIEGAELEKFGKRIQKLSTIIPVAANELLGIAQVAGQLGVSGNQNILKFTETIAKLGVATTITGEEGAASIARILSITRDGIGTVDRFGSVLVKLGNTVAANESQILGVTTELAKATAQFKIGSVNAVALGATLASLGQQAQLGGSVVGRTFREIDKAIRNGGKELKKFEELIGISGLELRETFEKDATKVFELFLKGLSKSKNSIEGISGTLEMLGLTGDEINKVLPVLAENVDKVSANLSKAKKEFKDNTALNKEAEKAFKTLGSEIIKTKNSIVNLMTTLGGEFADDITFLVEKIREMATNISEMDESIIQNTASILKWAAIITGGIAAASSLGIASIAISAGITAMGAAFLPATVAASAFWVAVTGPIGIAIAGLGLVAAGVIAMYVALDEGAEGRGLKEINADIDKQVKLLGELTAAHLDSHGNTTRLNQDLIDQQNKKVKLLEAERITFIENQEKMEKMASDAANKKNSFEKSRRDQNAKAMAMAHEKEIADNLALAETLRAQKLEQDEIDLGIKMTQEEADLERQILVDTMKLNNQKVKDQKDIDALKAKEVKLKGIRAETKKAEDQEDELRRSRLTAMGKFKEMLGSQEIQAAATVFAHISTLQTSENKKLVAIGKAAATANVIISTAVGIMKAFELGPIAGAILGPLVGIAGAAQIAKIHGAKMEKGGVFMGGNVGVDSIPAVVQQGEIVAPTQSYEELIGSVRAKREAEKINEGTGQGLGGNLSLVVSYDSEEASQIVTVRQTEDSALGISQQSFNQAV